MKKTILIALALLAPVACGTSGKAAEEQYCELVPMHAGICTMGEDHVLGPGYKEEDRVPFPLYSYLIKVPDGTLILADLGLREVAAINENFGPKGTKFFRAKDPKTGKKNPDDFVQPHGNILVQLEKLNVKPEQISHIVYTHLHLDHNGLGKRGEPGLPADFPNAVHHLSKRGWDHNLGTRKDGVYWSGYVDFDWSQYILKAGQKGMAVYRDDEVLVRDNNGKPLVWTMYLGGHSVCSQAVIVETRWGPAIFTSDDIYHYKFLKMGIIAQLHTTPNNLIRATDRLVELAEKRGGTLLPCHDPTVWEMREKHGEQWLVELKKISDNAIAGYKSRREKLKVILPGDRKAH